MEAPQKLSGLAVVTGANRGLGLELCRQLLERGWRVAALCRHSSIALDALTESAGASGDGSHVGNISQLTIIEAVDVAEDSCGALISRALMDAPVSLLICNAGVLSTDSLAALDTATIRQQFEVNALGPLRVAHDLLPNLRAAAAAARSRSAADGSGGAADGSGGAADGGGAAGGGGSSEAAGGGEAAGGCAGGTPAAVHVGARVAVITSKMGSIVMTGEGGKNGSVGYRMSKAAANMGTQLLALELAADGIPVLAIHPGAVATDMHRGYWQAVQAGAAGGMAPSAQGPVSVQAAAAGVLARLDEAGPAGTARFVQAADGSPLPW